MSRIITATDFTEIANNAVFYACDMAADINMPVELLHTYVVPVAPVHEAPMPVVSLDESKKIAEEQLNNFYKELKARYPALEITAKVVYGDITDTLKECTAGNDGSIVVVGNSSSEQSNFWLGSNLLNTLRNIHCPAIAIPAEYTYKKVDKIAFACDFERVSEHLPANQMLELTMKMNAQLHVLNVDHDNKAFDTDTPHEYARLNELIGVARPVYHNIDNKDVEEGIKSFVSGNGMDWLIVVPHRHNFFESLFHKSQTKALVQHATIPIVALHDKA